MRDLHSKNVTPHVGHVTGRIALLVIAFGVACLGLPSTGAVAAPTTTTTLSPNTLIDGNVYARSLLRLQPIPLGARHVTTLPTPIAPLGVVSDYTSHAWSLYELPSSVDVDQFVRAHVPSGEAVTETGSGGGPHVATVYSLELSLTCHDPHITFCGIGYSTTSAQNGEQELRIDAEVIYLPIIDEQMPTTGTVTVTGYGKTSLMNSSSDATSVVLTHHQILTLRTVIAELKDFGGGVCAEDSLLLKISIVRDGAVVWGATADECPGTLLITTPHSTTTLDNRSCAFWHVVDSFFAKGTAEATIADSKVCSVSPYG